MASDSDTGGESFQENSMLRDQIKQDDENNDSTVERLEKDNKEKDEKIKRLEEELAAYKNKEKNMEGATQTGKEEHSMKMEIVDIKRLEEELAAIRNQMKNMKGATQAWKEEHSMTNKIKRLEEELAAIRNQMKNMKGATQAWKEEHSMTNKTPSKGIENTKKENEQALANGILREGGALLAYYGVSYCENAAIYTVMNQAIKSGVCCSTTPIRKEMTITRHADAIINNASKTLGGKYTPDKFIRNEKCVDVANNASKESLMNSTMLNFLISGAVEGACAFSEINKLDKQREEGEISKDEFDRRVKKTKLGAFGATVGGVTAGLAGQMLCPDQGVGFVSSLGSYCGRWLFSSD